MVLDDQNPGFEEKAGVNALFQPGFFLKTGLDEKRCGKLIIFEQPGIQAALPLDDLFGFEP
jgi:hypothetical protein